MISTNQFKNGNHIDVEGTIFKILEFQHVKPGKGGAFVRTKLRRASDGNVIDRTFRAGEKFRAVRTEARKMQFLYADGTDAHFMDTELLRADGDARDGGRRRAALDAAQRRGRRAVHRRRARPTCSCPASVELEVTADRARPARRHRLGRRQQARDAGDRRDDPGAAVRQRRRPRQGPDAPPATTCRAPSAARRGPPLRATPRRRLRALPARRHRPPAATTLRARRAAVHARARARRRGLHARPRRDHRAPRRGLDGRPDRAAGEGDHAGRAARDAASRRGSRRQPDPAGGRDRGGRARPPRRSAAPRRRGSSTASSALPSGRCARMPRR